MAKEPKRHQLLLYEHLINRWRSAIFAIGISCLILAAGLGILPVMYPNMGFWWVQDWILWLFAGAGVYALILGTIFLTVRRSACLQVFPDYLRVSTPFSRFNISHKRIKNITPVEFQALFPFKAMPEWKQDMVEDFARYTCLVIDLNALPLSRRMLSLTLSPFFFPDPKGARMAFIIKDYLSISMELESARTLKKTPQQPAYISPTQNAPSAASAKPAAAPPKPAAGGLLGQALRQEKKRDQ